MIDVSSKDAEKNKHYRHEIEHFVNTMHEDIIDMENTRF